jgi:hypothetical protein
VLSDINYDLPENLLPKFVELIYVAFTSSYTSGYATGLVVFGFGSDELFPKLHEVLFDSAPLDLVRSVQMRSTDILRDGAHIIPLADREIMDTLIQGIDDHLEDVYIECASVIANEVAGRIIRDYLPHDDRLVATEIAKREIEGVIERFRTSIGGYVHQTNVGGMLRTLENMPKEDVAVLAEAMVEVTALRIKASEVVESVSGPVDVCLITKGDGLIWIKRKHYFDLNKNLQYLYRKYGAVAATFLGGDNGQG